ncbi:MAG: Peptide methionine sulfoxide reductase MsrA [Firmicutes bacterium]|nr:Peptide methionine sulfoxide reductase MsrA [candidate division NPL-UPA2 bacterium]MBT9153609.1 Peptide methionine sulfoxide reductase MsrA [candidate division NPL-UPA2 bacterium]MBT9155560.1 Peptide methionine sulfoxide reductase MsrA [candidate division NPL-UPA2 bacterium]
MKQQYEEAIFAGGCFWCMVGPFDILDGVCEVRSGYIGGHVTNPTYTDVKSQTSGHYEAVRITFDSQKITYEKLLHAFWMQIDPTDPSGQFHDRGPSYRTAIFYTTEAQRDAAEVSKQALQASGRFAAPIVTEILPTGTFYLAEDYHQDFYKLNPADYKEDRSRSGRDAFIKRHWGEDYFKLFE